MTSIEGEEVIVTTVGSFEVLPSVSSPSSEVSETSLEFPGELAVAVTVFDMLPLSIAA